MSMASPPDPVGFDIDQVDVPGADPAASRLIDQAKDLLARSVPAGLSDDRFGPDWEAAVQASGWLGAVARADTPLVALVGGPRAATTAEHPRPAFEVLVDLELPERAEVAAATVANALRVADPAWTVEVWAKPEIVGLDGTSLGLTPYRALHQMRVPIPLTQPAADLETRSYRGPEDDAAIVAVNNRAFASHPVQGQMTVESFRADASSDWFQPDGLRIAEIDGTMAGFCWTKIHPAEADREALGEIYVICVDPDFHGRGLGRPMTNAGLVWLVDQGLRTGMLYVEADNTPAIRTYEGMGFATVRTDRAWIRPASRG